MGVSLESAEPIHNVIASVKSKVPYRNMELVLLFFTTTLTCIQISENNLNVTLLKTKLKQKLDAADWCMKNSDNKLHIKTDPLQVSVNFDNVTYGKIQNVVNLIVPHNIS